MECVKSIKKQQQKFSHKTKTNEEKKIVKFPCLKVMRRSANIVVLAMQIIERMFENQKKHKAKTTNMQLLLAPQLPTPHLYYCPALHPCTQNYNTKRLHAISYSHIPYTYTHT